MFDVIADSEKAIAFAQETGMTNCKIISNKQLGEERHFVIEGQRHYDIPMTASEEDRRELEAFLKLPFQLRVVVRSGAVISDEWVNWDFSA